MLSPDDRHIATDEDGFLLDPEDWDRDIARAISREKGLPMSAAHWEVVEFVREHFETHGRVPEARHVLKHLAERRGRQRATRKYLYELFPYGYGQQACRIAGMRKPMKLWLAL